MQVISEIIETCRAYDFSDVILVHEHRGVPDGLIITHLPYGPTAYFGLLNVVCWFISSETYMTTSSDFCCFSILMLFHYWLQVTRHDLKDKKAIGTMPNAYPHLILNNFSTKVFHPYFNNILLDTKLCCKLRVHTDAPLNDCCNSSCNSMS